MSFVILGPIPNSLFDESTQYCPYGMGQPVLKEGRQPGGCYLKVVA